VTLRFSSGAQVIFLPSCCLRSLLSLHPYPSASLPHAPGAVEAAAGGAIADAHLVARIGWAAAGAEFPLNFLDAKDAGSEDRLRNRWSRRGNHRALRRPASNRIRVMGLVHDRPSVQHTRRQHTLYQRQRLRGPAETQRIEAPEASRV